jgi:catechol 2,3-dioxygenase-like lactoylglutathione lyase family enzyme
MISKLSHTTIWVLDQDEALDFYTQKLGSRCAWMRRWTASAG